MRLTGDLCFGRSLRPFTQKLIYPFDDQRTSSLKHAKWLHGILLFIGPLNSSRRLDIRISASTQIQPHKIPAAVNLLTAQSQNPT